MVANGEHTLAIKSDGSLWAWGRNDYGQLGDGSYTDRLSPVRVLTGVVAAAAGEKHTLALKTDGSVWAWGRNRNGELGDGTKTDRWRPVQVSRFDPLADFTVTSVVLAPRSPLANGTFSAAVTVTNRGTAAGVPGMLQVWANQAAAQGCGAGGDKSATVASLAAGASRTVTVSSLPAGAPGVKTLRVFIDSQCQSTETDETNNQSISAYTVAPSPLPDFAVTGIVLTPASPKANGTFSAAVTVKNQGAASANGGYLDLWTDQPTAQGCGADGNAYASVGTLAVGASKTLTFSGLRTRAAGTRTLRAFVDSYCQTAESNDGNNQSATGYSVVP